MAGPVSIFLPIISVDHLSQDFQDLPEDRILALGDQGILRQFVEEKRLTCKLLDEPINTPDVFGTLINQFLSTLCTLKDRPTPCEILLYLSGHGLEPGNIILVPDTLYAHPAREDLQVEPVEKWYTHNEGEQKYMVDFYKECMRVCKSSSSGFVGGELYAHQRGYVGILGVLGLWSYYTKCCFSSITHHLFIVADVCYAGVWGQTLQKIPGKLVSKHPVSIQCATGEFETSRGGVFTPLWYYLNTATEAEVRSLRERYEQQDVHVHDSDDDDDEIQHPCFFTTSGPRDPSLWKVYDKESVNFFIYLQKQVNKLVINEDCNCSLLDPYQIALDYVQKHFDFILESEERRVKIIAERGGPKLEKIKQCAMENMASIRKMKTPQSLYEWLFDACRSRPITVREYSEDNLGEAKKKQLKKKLCACEKKDTVNAGVYVFPGGKGDMSLIVAPVRGGEDEIILIDGGHTADCFIDAWEAILKHLKKITCIVVTHHDSDHANGIIKLLQRYCAEGSLTDISPALPDLTNTVIYMNTREDFLRDRNFNHEKSIKDSAEKLGIRVREMIVLCGTSCKTIVKNDSVVVYGLLPTQKLVEECKQYIPKKGKGNVTKGVPSRGSTTAANVLSINLAVVWKGTCAYLFTGDAYLKDVTIAAERFLVNHRPRLKKFEYVDVPHHGSWPSNGEKVEETMRGLARIPSENYLLSHDGSNGTPSPKTVKDILKSAECKKLHFLYKDRRQCARNVKECKDCETGPSMKTWKCCITDDSGHIGKELNKKMVIELDASKKFKFFPFLD